MADNHLFSAARGPYEHPTHLFYSCDECKKEYSTVHHLNTHQRTGCIRAKRSLSLLLEDTKLFWENKRRRTTPSAPEPHQGSTGSSVSGPTVRSDSGTVGSSRVNSPFSLPASSSSLTVSPITCSSPTDSRPAYIAPEEASNRAGRRKAAPPSRFIHDKPIEPVPVVDWKQIDRLTQRHGLSNVGTTEGVAGHGPKLVTCSVRDAFGVSRQYELPEGRRGSLQDPDGFVTLAYSTFASTAPPPEPDTPVQTNPVDTSSTVPISATQTLLGPFTTKSEFVLAEWYWQSSRKSLSDFRKLVAVLQDPSFRILDISKANWKSSFKALGSNKDDISEEDGAWIQDHGWKTTEISIDVPFHNYTKDPGSKPYIVGEFKHRSIVSIIKEKLSNRTESRNFHYYPYKSSWKRTPDSPEVNLYGELYASQAFRDAHQEVNRKPATVENEGLERVVVALMFWSDATHLTAFGGANLWPCYMFFGNESKHLRGEPSKHLGHHIAYFIQLPDSFKDYLWARNKNSPPPRDLITHCKKVLFHKQWLVLLDRELTDAMRDGIVIECPDKQKRCFYPRIMSYSADYPEKIRVYGLRNNGSTPCHRCLVPSTNLHNLGTPVDTERVEKKRVQPQERADIELACQSIREGYAVKSAPIERRLQHQSLIPAHTAFSERNIPVNLAAVLAADILHEFEIGTWKTLWIHLLRLLDAVTARGSLSAELDARYRSVPPFGHDTIRKFPLNASEMKRKAARDYEDLLQCSIPAYEGLLPDVDDGSLLALLYICAQWHALAKLRLHNDFTLDLLEYTTVQLGAHIRRFFRDTCSKYKTKELQREADARAKRALKSGGDASAARRPAALGIFTIKFHYLGDYVSVIRRLGTTDSYSSQTGELYHREPKSWYPRTDRNNFESQMSQIERRRSRLIGIRATMEAESEVFSSSNSNSSQCAAPKMSYPEQYYTMGLDQNCPMSLNAFRERFEAHRDSYTIGFIRRLKQHLLPRILAESGITVDTVATDAWQHVVLGHDCLYSHKILRINYATYDVREGKDIIHVDTPRCNIMVLNGSYNKETWRTESPYRYGRVLGVFHANASCIGTLPAGVQPPDYHRIEFVWVQWYSYHPGEGEFALDRVSLRPVESEDGTTFLDPAYIIRAAHLIPRFSLGKRSAPARKSQLVSSPSWSLWKEHYINKFADRDMFMRFQYGMSVGHTYMHTPSFPSPVVPSIPPDFDHCLDIMKTCGQPTERDSSGNVPISSQAATAIPDTAPPLGVASAHVYEEQSTQTGVARNDLDEEDGGESANLHQYDSISDESEEEYEGEYEDEPEDELEDR